MKTIANALLDLGSNVDEISAKLLSLGIKGVAGDACDCPVAKYLKKECAPESDIRVSRSAVRLYKESEWVRTIPNQTVDLPLPVVHWIRAFDNDHLPQFEE